MREIVSDFPEMEPEPFERVELSGNRVGERPNGDVLDVSEEMLYTDFFGLFGLDG